MSKSVIEHEGRIYDVKPYPMDEILHDAEFNMRGRIAPIDVMDLKNDIEQRGLDFPIVLQPFTDEKNPNIKYRIVAGHRRHLAFKLLDRDTIPAYVRTDLTEITARMLNLRENVNRAATNIMQEAKHIDYFLRHKLTETTIGDMIGQSRGWVQIRVALLKLPADIQEVAAKGAMSQEQIRHAGRLVANKEKLYEFIRKIKEARERGETLKPAMTIKQTKDVLKSKTRNKTELQELSDVIYDALGPCLGTRVLAWAAGNISTAQVHASIKEAADEMGLPYKIPDYVNRALVGYKV